MKIKHTARKLAHKCHVNNVNRNTYFSKSCCCVKFRLSVPHVICAKKKQIVILVIIFKRL